MKLLLTSNGIAPIPVLIIVAVVLAAVIIVGSFALTRVNEVKIDTPVSTKDSSMPPPTSREPKTTETSTLPVARAPLSPRWESSFPVDSSPLVWHNWGITYTLTKVELGDTEVPPSPWNDNNPVNNNVVQRPSGRAYEVGTPIHAVTLYFLLSSGSSWFPPHPFNIASLSLMRLLDEAGNFAEANTENFIPGVFSTNQSISDRPVVFIVPRDEKEFVFTTGGSTNVYFSVRALDDETINVKREPIVESGVPENVETYSVNGVIMHDVAGRPLGIQLLVVGSDGRAVKGLDSSSFSLETLEVTRGGCPIFLDQQHEIVETMPGYYTILITSNCAWSKGFYTIGITVSTPRGRGTGLMSVEYLP